MDYLIATLQQGVFIVSEFEWWMVVVGLLGMFVPLIAGLGTRSFTRIERSLNDISKQSQMRWDKLQVKLSHQDEKIATLHLCMEKRLTHLEAMSEINK